DGAPQPREGHRLHEELHKNVAPPGPDGLANADLPGSFGHGDEHDVHDPDTADEESDADHPAHDPGHVTEDVGDRLEDLLLRQDAEIVALPLLQVMPQAKGLGDLLAGQVEVAAGAHLEGQNEPLHVVRTVHDGGRGERNENDVVAVLAELAALLLHDADDSEAIVVDGDLFADGIA